MFERNARCMKSRYDKGSFILARPCLGHANANGRGFAAITNEHTLQEASRSYCTGLYLQSYHWFIVNIKFGISISPGLQKEVVEFDPGEIA
jgi:hypothetical protein